MIEYGDITGLEEKIKSLPNDAESVINRILHTKGLEIATHEMTNLIPVSKRNSKHAKHSKWYAFETPHLQFVLKSKGGAANKKGSFGYLVFPDEGRGPSNLIEQNFSGRAMQRATPKILQELSEGLDNLLREGL
ncbi:hypothetical protein [Metasolibacillus meyeri]|uniref:hypothetical protein n=1 Tax=Metasolibacillus meyeri TaxID=1071052 RepID=UPI0030828DA4